MSTPVYRALAHEMRRLGVRRVFGLSGEDTVQFNGELAGVGVEYVGVRHEATALAMADGHAWATGELGVCTVTRGPGLTNALTAARTAVRASSRVLVITGETPTHSQLRWMIKDIDTRTVCTSLGLGYVSPPDARSVLDQARRAAAAAMSGLPTVLAIAADMYLQEVPASATVHASAPPMPRRATTADITRMVDLLARSERPLILAGRGAAEPVTRAALVTLAERTGGLLGTTLPLKGHFAESPYDLGVVGGFAADPAIPVLGAVDLVLAFGASLNWFTTAEASLFAGIPVVQVVIEAPRDPVCVPVALTIHADATVTAEQLLAALPDHQGKGVVPDQHRPEVLEQLAKVPYAGSEDETSDEGLDPRALARVFNEILPADRAIIVDIGILSTGPARYITVRGPNSFRHAGDGGAIGLGLGLALGAALGRPDRTTALFAGDGGFSMALADLETAARHAIPLIMVISDNKAYGAEFEHLRRAGLPFDAALLPMIDYPAMAHTLGIEAMGVRTVDELRSLAPRLSNRTAPLLIHAHVRRDLAVIRPTWA